jgi:hypothetical protein
LVKSRSKGKDCVKLERLFERSRHFGPLNPEWGRGGPHVCVKICQRGSCECYIMEMCHISTPELFYLSAPIHVFTSFLYVKKLALSLSAN